MVGYSWTWDLERITAADYRNMLMDILMQQGFEVYPTNEANVMMRPENLFMARIEARVLSSDKDQFELAWINLDVQD